MSATSVSTDEVTLTLEGDYGYDYFVLSILSQGGTEIANNIAGTNAEGKALTNNVSHTVDGLSPNTEYAFSLQACIGATCSEETVDTTVVTRPMEPGKFAFVKEKNTSTSLSFTWEAPTPGGANHYKLYQDNNAIEKNIEDTNRSVSGLESGTEYTFDLVACNVNNLCSTTNTRQVTTPPGKATGLVIKGDPGSTEITISWVEPPATTSYVVSKQKEGETTEVVDNTLSSGDTEFTIGDLISETKYTFSLQACNDAGCSEPVTVNEQTVEIVYPPANAPGNFKYTSISSTAVELEWEAVAGATFYSVLYKIGGDPEVSNHVVGTGKFSTTALTANTEYIFSVLACNSQGCSQRKSITPPPHRWFPQTSG